MDISFGGNTIQPTLRFRSILSKISARFSVDIDKIILKIIWKGKEFRIAKTILKNKNEMKEISLLDFKTLYSYRNQDCVILVGEQTHGSVEHNKEPRNRLTQICTTGF